MNFKKQPFGFMDMLRFKKMVPTRRKMLAQGDNKPLPQEYRTNTLAKKLHPGYMQVELVAARPLTDTIRELTFKRADSDAFPFFRGGQYVSLQMKIGESLVSRPYSIVSTPQQALQNKLVLAVENAGFVSEYLNKTAKVGDRFVMTEPSGEFHYETLRDSEQIICIAGGSGITPFLSMAGSLADGDESYSMLLFYGARTAAQLAYKAELDELTQRCNRLKVVYVLSDEAQPSCESGFVSAELMKKYTDLTDRTFFLCHVRVHLQRAGSPEPAPKGGAPGRRLLPGSARGQARLLYPHRPHAGRGLPGPRHGPRDPAHRHGAGRAERPQQVPGRRLRLLPQQVALGPLPCGGGPGRPPGGRPEIRLYPPLRHLSPGGYGDRRTGSLLR